VSFLDTGGLGAQVKLWDLGPQQATLRILIGDVVTIDAQLMFSPDGRWLLTTGVLDRAEARPVSLSELDRLTVIDLRPDFQPQVAAKRVLRIRETSYARWDKFLFTFSQDGKWAAIGTGRQVWVFEVGTWKLIHAMTVNPSDIVHLTFSSDSRRLFGTFVGKVKTELIVWDRETGQQFLALNVCDKFSLTPHFDGAKYTTVRHMLDNRLELEVFDGTPVPPEAVTAVAGAGPRK
jgi:WD40 repeat protein